jgi:hypothetical protein
LAKGQPIAAAPLDTEDALTYAQRALEAEVARYLCEPIIRTTSVADADLVSKGDRFVSIANIFSSQLLALA